MNEGPSDRVEVDDRLTATVVHENGWWIVHRFRIGTRDGYTWQCRVLPPATCPHMRGTPANASVIRWMFMHAGSGGPGDTVAYRHKPTVDAALCLCCYREWGTGEGHG